MHNFDVAVIYEIPELSRCFLFFSTPCSVVVVCRSVGSIWPGWDYILGCCPSNGHRPIHYMFNFRDPNLNLHFPPACSGSMTLFLSFS